MESPVSFDPVAAPDAYRRSLLTAVGEQDPVAVLGAGPGSMRQLVVDAQANLRIRPEAGEWSVIECLAHLTDAELVTGGRLRWIAAEDEPDIVGYDQDLWVNGLRQVDEDPESLLAAYGALRRWNLDLWARVPEADRTRVGVHRERGRESFELTFRLLAGHDLVHLDQARRTLEVVRAMPVG
jgi:hypothetical protein